MRRALAAAIVVLTSIVASPFGDASADEELAPKEVVAVMTARRLQIRKLCYETRADKADTALKVDFTVAANGIVTDAVARDASGPEAIVACVVAEVKKTAFPASAKGGFFRWPFIFKGP